MKNPLEGKRILLGVTGSIAAYKAADLASKLAQAGAEVDVILTRSAAEFVSPLTFQSVTSRQAYIDEDLWGRSGHVVHIGLAGAADLLVIAPASANTLAKLAHGLGDNLLTVTALAAQCPVLAAPAMDGGMYAHPATQANLSTLRQRGVQIIGPEAGHLASGMRGVGRMVEPAELLGHIRRAAGRGGPLAGRKLIVTAGGTQEPIDPVRVIANRSSGKQGFALAQAALDLGAQVILVTGPVSLPTPAGARRIDVDTAEQMLAAVMAELLGTDALLMAAAVADFRPADSASQKIKKEDGLPEIRLEATPDILAQVAGMKSETGWPRLTVGFAAESQDLLENARSKLEAKRLDLIAANDVSAQDAGFEVDTNRVVLLHPDGSKEALPLMSKAEVAGAILERVVRLLALQPLPENPTVRLRPVRMEDAEELFPLIYNTPVVDTILWDGPESLDGYRQSLAERAERVRRGEGHIFTILEPGSDAPIGTASIRPDERNFKATIGLWVGEPYHGRGYGTQALEWLLEYGFNTLNLTKIESCAFTGNQASRRIHEKAGFRLEGTSRQAELKRGRPVDEWLFGITREEYLTRKR